jgi:anthranilate synthase component 1
VQRLRESIYAGEAFQIVLSHRRERPVSGTLLPMVDRLRRHERYAYLYYLRGERTEVVGASPESVVEVHQGHVAVSPIAGTRPYPPPPRGPLARLPLDKDPKELAEHRMLVDLARNDVGRVSEMGTVRITRRETKVPYSKLEHLVSRVVGRLAPGRTALDALGAAFPAGTVSGAPKIRATQLLRREEGTWRGPYGGAVGIFDGPTEAEFALIIRSGFASRGKVYTAAGAGIVHLSEPDREWRETLTKLASVEEALTGGSTGPERRTP